MKKILAIIVIVLVVGASGAAAYSLLKEDNIAPTTENMQVTQNTPQETTHDDHAGHDHATTPSSGAVNSTSVDASAPEASSDVLNSYVEGSDDAPVTIYEFASFSCGHCGNFHNNVLPDLKEQVIATGKAKFVFRDYPLNAPAFDAAKLSHCVDQSRHKGMVDMLFKNQERWLSSKDYRKTLSQMGRLAGLSEDDFNACLENPELDTALLTQTKEVQDKYNLHSTPSFVIVSQDGRIETMSGVRPVSDFEAVINKLQ